MLKMMKAKNGRVLSVILAVVLVLGTMCVPAFADDTYAGGYHQEEIVIDGVAYNFVINTTADLKTLEDMVEGRNTEGSPDGIYNVLLMSDIVTPSGWDGIGVPQSSVAFTGSFNGNGHTITTSITNTQTVGPKGGLFNFVEAATITDLNITGSVSSNRFIGGIVGRVVGDLIMDNCHVINMNLTLSSGMNNSIGGLVGQCGAGAGSHVGDGSGGPGNSSGDIIISNCSVNGGTFTSNTPSNPVGGMIGHVYANYYVEMADCSMAAGALNCEGGTVAAYIANNAAQLVDTDTTTTGVYFVGECSYSAASELPIIGGGSVTAYDGSVSYSATSASAAA